MPPTVAHARHRADGRPAIGQPAGPGDLHRAGARRAGPAGAGAASAWRRSTKRCTACKADDTPDPLRVFYRREYSRGSARRSRASTHFIGYSGTRAAAAARGGAGRCRSPTSRPTARAAAGAQGVPGRDLLGGRRSSPTPRAAATRQGRLPRLADDMAADRPRRHHRHAGRRRRRPHDHDARTCICGWSRRASSPKATRWRCRRSSTTTWTTPAPSRST